MIAMRRITPRTCLWPITITLLCTFGLSIGLTYRSSHHCFAGVCGEWLFPLQARLHVVVWYTWISITVTCLAIRAFSPGLRRLLHHPLLEKRLPVLDKHLAVSGVLVFCWIISLYGIIVGIWWARLHTYFTERGVQGGVTAGNARLAAIALTGHLCDVTMGMVLLPISRHSALASLFKMSVSTTLTFHMIVAYTLFTLVLIHGILYLAWLPVVAALSSPRRHVFPVLNPTYLYDQVWPGNQSSLGIWRGSLVFTGLVCTCIMALIFITTLPPIRRNHFNIFYFSHLMVIVAVVIVCLHASTMLYCTSPGLILWVLDWAMRFYELKREVKGTITSLGNGYYSLAMPMSRTRLKGCACTSPLAHFYIYHYESSIRELHPFTTTTHLASAKAHASEDADDVTIEFLFRKRRSAPLLAAEPKSDATEPSTRNIVRILTNPKAKTKAQWTEKIASEVDRAQATRESRIGSVISLNTIQDGTMDLEQGESIDGDMSANICLRFEGPYFTPADPARYRTVICLVAGTGISGAIAIASAFEELQRQRKMAETTAESCSGQPGTACTTNAESSIWQRCIVVWSVRENEYVDLQPFFKMHNDTSSGLEFRVQLTGGGRPRMDFEATVRDILASNGESLTQADGDVVVNRKEKEKDEDASTWVYLSGPNNFIISGEAACKALKVQYYGARWEI